MINANPKHAEMVQMSDGIAYLGVDYAKYRLLLHKRDFL